MHEFLKRIRARFLLFWHCLKQFLFLQYKDVWCQEMGYSDVTMKYVLIRGIRVPLSRKKTTYGLACNCGRIFYTRKGYELRFWLERAREAKNMKEGRHRWQDFSIGKDRFDQSSSA